MTERLVRDRITLTAFAALGLQGFLLNGLGSILAPLQEQLGVSRAEVAFYPSLFAVALIVVGLFGGTLTDRLGHRLGLTVSVSGMAFGALLLGAPVRSLTLIGAVLLGLGAALSIALVPAVLVRRHPTMVPAAFGEANAVASVMSIVAPAAVASALAVGLGWRFGYVGPTLPVAVLLVVLLLRSAAAPGAPDSPADSDAGYRAAPVGAGLEPGRLLPRWAAVLVAVSVEFCLVFWAAEAFIEWHDRSIAAAAALSSAFLVGMAVVRTFSTRLTSGRDPLQVVAAGCAATLLGFAAFWSLPSVVGATIGLFVAGGGVALMFPSLLARVVASRPDSPDRSARLSTVASGLAIGGTPLILARLSDSFGLRAAYLIVPVLLIVLAGYSLATLRSRAARPTGQAVEQPTAR